MPVIDWRRAVTEPLPASFGRYHLLARLAVGGMAEVFLARDRDATDDQTFVVIKRLLPHLAGREDFVDMFMDEGRLTGKLEHPCIARTYEQGSCEGRYFLAMEFVDGIDVLTMMRECAGLGRRLAPAIGVYVMHQVLDALAYVHTLAGEDGQPLGVVHRDISPSNVLISQSGEVKLIDFGIAWATQRNHQTRAGLLKGKVGYMSPEQVARDEVDARSDLFSAAVVLAEMLMGRRLFVAARELDTMLMVRFARLERLDRFGQHIDAELDRILRRALQANPMERVGSAAAFRDALGAWLRRSPQAIDAGVLGSMVRKLYPGVWQRRQRGSVDAAGAASGAASGAGPGAARTWSQASDTEEDAAGSRSAERSAPGAMADEGLAEGVARALRAAERSARHAAAETTVLAPSPFDDWAEEGRTEELRMEDLGPDTGERFEVAGSERSGGGAGGFEAEEPASSTRDTMHGLPLALLMESMAAAAAAENARAGSLDHADGDAPAERDTLPAMGAPELQGALADTSPLAMLHRLARDGATGRLAVSSGESRKVIHLRDGVPVQVVSNVFSEHFGEFLVRQGAVSPGELSMVLAMVTQYGESLDQALVSLGLMSREDIALQRSALLHRQIADVCTWNRGTYCWSPGQEPSEPAPGVSVDLLAALGAGALAVPDEIVHAWLERLGAPGELHPRVTDLDACSGFGAGTLVQEVCGQLDGELTMAGLEERFATGGRGRHALRVVYLLEQTGLVSFEA